MKKVWIILLVIIIFCSFSISDVSKVNGKKMHIITTECGTVEIRSFSPAYITIIPTGEYILNKDSLKVKTNSKEVNVTYSLKNLYTKKRSTTIQNITESSIKTKIGDCFRISLNFECDKIFFRREATIYILPCDFIMCDNKRVINDTIRIKLPR